MKIDYEKLSKAISHALRHKPELYGLLLDRNGFVEIDHLIDALKNKDEDWKGLSRSDLEYIIESSSKRRHEIVGKKIRAIYGHSVVNKIHKKVIEPPEFLFHGTVSGKIKEIFIFGLLPMSRQYVHLTQNVEEAINVASRRKNKEIKILLIKARQASKEGIKFYEGDEQTWLADHIPAKYIQYYESGTDK